MVMEIFYKMDFSLPGFLLCCLILGFGVHQTLILVNMTKKAIKLNESYLILGF